MRVHPGTSQTLLRSMIHHAAPLLPFSSVVALPIAMVQAALGTALVDPARLTLRLGPLFPPASGGAVPVSAITAWAQVEQPLACATPSLAHAHRVFWVRLGRRAASWARARGGTLLS